MCSLDRKICCSIRGGMCTSLCRQCWRVNAKASSEKGSAAAAGRPCCPWVALWGALTPDGEKAMHTPSLGMYSCKTRYNFRVSFSAMPKTESGRLRPFALAYGQS